MDPTIIATYGGSDSNTYISYEEANAFFDTKVNRDGWDDATEPKRKAALIEATRNIDARVWRGNRFYYHQKLEFPRTMYSDENPSYPGEVTPLGGGGVPNTNVDWEKMKERVEYACCEQALHILELGGDDTITGLRKRGVTSYSESIGKISESYSFGGGSSVLGPEAARMLSFYRATPRLVRG